MQTATIRLLDLVRASQDSCTDYRVSKLIGINTTAVSKWRTGKGHMSPENVAKACRLAGLDDAAAWLWQARVGAERDTGEARRHAIALLADLEGMQRGQAPQPGGLAAVLLNLGRSVAAVVAAVVVTLALAIAPVKPASALPSPGPDSANRSIPYAKFRRWLRGRVMQPA